MPTGFTDSLTLVARLIEWLQPRRAFDIGVGNGRTAFVAREYGHQPWHPPAGGDGIEDYDPYIGDLQRAIYDRLVIGDTLDVLAPTAGERQRYDVAIAADILEYFAREEARRFFTRCLAVADLVVVATPRTFVEHEDEENVFETHRSHWPEHELLRAGAPAVLYRGDSLVVLFGDIAQYLASRRKRLRHRLLPPALVELGHFTRTRLRLRERRA